jgi:hypothetical protein
MYICSSFLCLDIIAYFKGKSENPFASISRLYHLHVSSRENKFLDPSEDPTVNTEDESKIDIELKFILLPNQILILPISFFNKIGFDVSDDIEVLSKGEVR